MENKKKCSSEEHNNIDANYYCQDCKIYICNKCEIHHNALFKNHNKYKLDKEINEIFNNICKEENHPNKLEYYCKNHNELCCANCVTKIKGKGNGQHKDCEVCFIENIKEEKKNKLKENIKYLEDLSNNIESSINKIKEIIEKTNEKKEEMKIKIQKIFTKIRTALNDREDELLLEVNNIYEDTFKDINIKKLQILPNNIKISLEKGKLINEEKKWNDNKTMYSIIKDCINIENNIKDINSINDKLKNGNLNDEVDINFSPENKELDDFIQNVKTFGKIISKNYIINKNDFDLISTWINKNISKYELLYKATVDGDSIDDFIKKCENKGPNILIVKSKKGQIFGGYTEKNWTKGKSIASPDSFLFNLNIRKKFTINNNGYIHLYSSEFGYGSNTYYELQLYNNFLSRDNLCNQITNYKKSYSNQYELTNGDKSFKIEEIEVFKVNYN